MYQVRHLITIEKIKQNSRFISKHIDDKRIEVCIEESERLDIKPQLGDTLFLSITEWIEDSENEDFPNYSVLMNGGIYENRLGQKIEFAGLEATLCYYAYARLVKTNNFSLTRFGFVEKTDQYSQQADLKERLATEKDARSIADAYMFECFKYLEENKSKFPAYRRGKQKNRLRISTIGD